jgi:D-arabinose 1-dehydrogenase-like Zn-dependent alcohol dehydrogenase
VVSNPARWASRRITDFFFLADLHTLRSGWGPTMYPQVVGHEIVGVALRVGSAVTHVKVGDRVGVGAQSDSCRTCDECRAGREAYCPQMVGTYNGKYADGSKSSGGYADFARAPGHFVFKIPDALPSAIVAPMLCGECSRMRRERGGRLRGTHRWCHGLLPSSPVRRW